MIRQIENGVALLSAHPSELDRAVPTPSSLGPADYEVFIGTRQDTYTTGTVSMANGSRTLTGTDTSWTTPQGLGRGTMIQIGALVFTTKSVDNATQITTYEAASSAIAAGTVYTALLTNPVVQLYTIPDTAENYYYRAQRIPAVLDADVDIPDLPHYLHSMLKPYVLQFLWEMRGQFDRKASAQATYDRMLARALRQHSFFSPDRIYQRHSADRATWPFRQRMLVLQ